MAANYTVRGVVNEKLKNISKTLQGDFHHNQRRFWAKVRSRAKGKQEAGSV